MISKSLFFKVQKEELKKKVILLFITFICMFLALPIYIAVEMQKYQQWLQTEREKFSKEQISGMLADILGTDNLIILLIIFVLAFVFAFCQLEYLYHREKVDFYHSLPIKRGRLFAIQYMNGVLVFVVPYVLCVILGLCVLAAGGFCNGLVLKASLTGILVHIIGYLLCYTTVSLAVCLTGNLFTGVLAAATFHGYGVALSLLIDHLFYESSTTFMSGYGNRLIEKIAYASPLYVYKNLGWGTSQRGATGAGSVAVTVIGSLVYLILLAALAYYAYLKRPSESAGKAVSFARLKPIIKVCVIPVVACIGSLQFKAMVYDTEKFWQVIGFVITLLLSHAMIQSIFEQDVKAVKKGLGSTAVAAVAGILIFAGCDLCGKAYDRAEIDYDHLQYAAIMPSTIDTGNYYYNMEEDTCWSMVDYVFEHMKIQDKDLVKDFTKECIVENQEKHFYGVIINVKYTLENGKEFYRRYHIDYDTLAGYMDRFFEHEEFRKGINYAFGIDLAQVIQINYQNGYQSYYNEGYTMNLSQKDLTALLTAYQEEYLSASVEELNDYAPIAGIYPCSLNKYDNTLEEWGKLYVYPSFTKTIDLLKKGGMDVSADSKGIAELREISVNRVEIIDEDEEGRVVTLEAEVSYQRRNEMTNLLDYIALEPYCYQTGYNNSSEIRNGHTVHVKYINEFGEEMETDALFIKEVPQWVTEDLDKKARTQLSSPKSSDEEAVDAMETEQK